MKRAALLLIGPIGLVGLGLWIPALCRADCLSRGRCPSENWARITIRDVGRGGTPGSYMIEPGARVYRGVTYGRQEGYGRLEEVREPGHSLPELLVASRPDPRARDLVERWEPQMAELGELWQPWENW